MTFQKYATFFGPSITLEFVAEEIGTKFSAIACNQGVIFLHTGYDSVDLSHEIFIFLFILQPLFTLLK